MKQIAIVIAILMALTPLEAAKNKKKHSIQTKNLANIEAVANLAFSRMGIPADSLGGRVILSDVQYKNKNNGKGFYQTAVAQNVGKTNAAIARSAWSATAKSFAAPLARAMGNLPRPFPGLAVTKHSVSTHKTAQTDNWEGTYTRGGYVFCWTSTAIYIDDP